MLISGTFITYGFPAKKMIIPSEKIFYDFKKRIIR
jgi:hypothetical protein